MGRVLVFFVLSSGFSYTADMVRMQICHVLWSHCELIIIKMVNEVEQTLCHTAVVFLPAGGSFPSSILCSQPRIDGATMGIFGGY